MATFLRYVKIQLVVFVFGIVGPIFLIIFFATQPDPTTKWAYWAGLFITMADVLIALAITNASDPRRPPLDVRLATRIGAGGDDHSNSSNSYDPFSSNAFSFAVDSTPYTDYSSTDYSSSDYSSNDYSSSCDSGSSFSDSGSSSSDSCSSSDSGSSSSSD